MNQNRRSFISFLGKSSLVAAAAPWALVSCKSGKALQISNATIIKGIAPSDEDALLLAQDLEYEVLIKWGDPLAENLHFGFNNDFTALVPLSDDEGLLWVNHEYINTLFVTGPIEGEKSKSQVEHEMKAVGGSIVHVKKNNSGKWKVVENSSKSKRVSGLTEISLNWPNSIQGSNIVLGTLANCSGGITPWGTILTCEENYDAFYGERMEDGSIGISKYDVGWRTYYPLPPEHYGWVVEVDVHSGGAQKHIALGRCAHECATVHELEDGRLVVYTGDDARDECLYKFVSSEKGSLKSGTLYAAEVASGRWLPIDITQQKILQENFGNQTEVLTYLRRAAHLIGATPLDRPEDIEIDPITGDVLIALTNNKPKENYFGSLLKIKEKNGYDGLEFEAETYLAGGEQTGFACPDNMVFDKAGNLWFTSDISGGSMNKPPYEAFKNNGLFVVPRSGPQAGEVIQIASAPTDAELTGPWFSDDGKTLFLSVQHPGERSKSLDALTSNWPDGGDSVPKPSVVTIQGKLLEKIQGLG